MAYTVLACTLQADCEFLRQNNAFKRTNACVRAYTRVGTHVSVPLSLAHLCAHAGTPEHECLHSRQMHSSVHVCMNVWHHPFHAPVSCGWVYARVFVCVCVCVCVCVGRQVCTLVHAHICTLVFAHVTYRHTGCQVDR